MHVICPLRHTLSPLPLQHVPNQKHSFSQQKNVTHICRDSSSHVEIRQSTSAKTHEPIWVYVDAVHFSSLLSSVTTLSQGYVLHNIAACIGLEDDDYLANPLISMYGRCGALLDACAVFDSTVTPNVVSWTALITCFVMNGHDRGALQIFRDMKNSGMEANRVTFLTVLRACTNIGSSLEGRMIHACVVESGLQSDVAVETSLVNMYDKCNTLEDACILFDKMRLHNVVAWTSMIAVYAGHGRHEEAVLLFWHMQSDGVDPNEPTFMNVLGACASPRALPSGRLIHALVLFGGFDEDVGIGTALVTMYSKCGEVEDAASVFGSLRPRNLVSWTAMMTAYKEYEQHEDCLLLYKQMLLEGCKPDNITFTIVLNACASLSYLSEGMCIHMTIGYLGLEADVRIASALLDMYGKVGALPEAYSLFNAVRQRDRVLWSAMISACILKGHRKEGLQLFQKMQEEKVEPDEVTYLSVLGACGSPEELDDGRTLHSRFTQVGLSLDLVGGSLISMYANCGELEDALRVFQAMQSLDIVAFNAVITACVQHGVSEKALDIFSAVQMRSNDANEVTFISLLNACAGLVALQKGRKIHALIVEAGFNLNSPVENALFNFYSKTGALEDVHVMFDKLSSPSMLSWTAFVTAYAQHGLGKEALFVFRRMQEEGVVPDEVTLVALLSACNHAGMVDAGADIFVLLSSNYRMELTADRFAGLVDLLCRAGRLMEAECYLSKLPLEISNAHWSSLLSSSLLHNAIGLSRKAATYMFDVDP
ncbi:hypothetical protein GOP47_0020351 [Adiantum capillus-veneris]|uniref:Pentatricopeptide repeat-containing protein n=1 Tax=Adiantum capillus-veneris TaxID=13818 RepID=A0A9D4UEC7_ADICA|nr:hypothetical protein GOP47_0020351 [Adiantum capillus-veneris]